MSQDRAILSVDGYAAVDPYELFKDLRRAGYPVEPFWGRANRIECPLGFDAGSAFVLMDETDVNNLGTNWHTLLWYSGGVSTRFQYYTYWAAREVVPDAGGSGPYLVEFRDKRQVMKMSVTDKSYNVRRPTLPWSDTDTDDAYYYDSLNTGNPWQWTEVVNDLWQTLPSGIRGPTPTLSLFPALKPIDLNFNGTRTWTEALPRVLGQCLSTVALNPVANTFTIVQRGAVQGVDPRALVGGQLVYEDFPFENEDQARLPEKFKFYFPKRLPFGFGQELSDGAAGGVLIDPYYSIEKTTGGSSEAGTVVPFRMDQFAEYKASDGTIANQTELDSLASSWKDTLKTYHQNAAAGCAVYRGVLTTGMPGSQIERVVWRDYGDRLGMVTEVHRMSSETRGADELGGFNSPDDVAQILGPEEFIVKNVTGGALKAGSIVRRTTTGTSKQILYYQVDKPDGTLRRRYVVTLGQIADQKFGRATWADRMCPVLYDTADGVPADGEEWGPKPNATILSKDYYGFRALGGTIGAAADTRGMFQGHEIVEAIGFPDTTVALPWAKDTRHDVKVQKKAWGGDTGMIVSQVNNVSQAISLSTDKIIVSWPAGDPTGSKMNCS